MNQTRSFRRVLAPTARKTQESVPGSVHSKTKQNRLGEEDKGVTRDGFRVHF